MSNAVPRDPANVMHARKAAHLVDGPIEEQKRSFLRMVSHELRTPLNSILGFSEILTTQLFGPLGDERYLQYAAVIRESGEKLLRLVNQLLEIARLDGGELDLDLAPEPVEPLVTELLAGLEGEIAQRGLRVACADLSGVVARGDARALRAVLSGLIANAVAFSPVGGEVRIRGAARGAEIEIVIGNDGDGVDPTELPRLLRPFEQGENALTRRAQGAGLGLAICDLACRAMSGRLELASGPGEGFSAHVFLPAA